MAFRLEIVDLHAEVEGMPILRGVNLVINSGEIHAIMGPNGSGKSTLTKVIMGHPKYVPTAGKVLFNGVDVLELDPSERSQLGIFLAFQYPKEISGVTFVQFLTAIYNAHLKKTDPEAREVKSFRLKAILAPMLQELKLDAGFLTRYLNEGFSGGEKKKAEILQMKLLNPLFSMLDETDSGLDVDALKIVGEAVNAMANEENGVLLVTHYRRILEYVQPQFVHVMKDGVIVQSGGYDLALELESNGYEGVNSNL
jgi:Fe-S cluster assembly ATP-binding protein